MSALRITILQGAFFPGPPVRGGAVEKLWHRLAIEFARAGHAVTQVSRAVPELPADGELEGVRHLRVPGRDQPASGLALKWADLLYTRRALRAAPDGDILVTNTFWSPILGSSRHGRIHVSVERMPRGQMRLYRRAARLRANSAAVAAAIRSELPRVGERLVVIPNPLPAAPDRPPDPTRRRRRFLFVGRLHPEKGIALLLAAFASAKSGGALAGWTLELVGPADVGRGGGGEAWLRELLRRHAHPEVSWNGPVYDPGILSARYESATVFVYPSLAEKGESFGLAPLEAMAWGCVPLVSDLACFKDFIRPGENGLVFDHRAQDPVASLARSLASATLESGPLSSAALRVRDTHSPARIAADFLADFRRLVPVATA